MNPPEYNTVANELLPRFMFKLGKFITYDNDTIATFCQKLDEIEKYKTSSENEELKLYFNQNIANIIDIAIKMVNIRESHKSVTELIEDYNPNIRMPTNAINMLLSYIWDELQTANFSTDIITSASEVITCSKKEFDIITQSVIRWLSTNKEHYVIL